MFCLPFLRLKHTRHRAQRTRSALIKKHTRYRALREHLRIHVLSLRACIGIQVRTANEHCLITHESCAFMHKQLCTRASKPQTMKVHMSSLPPLPPCSQTPSQVPGGDADRQHVLTVWHVAQRVCDQCPHAGRPRAQDVEPADDERLRDGVEPHDARGGPSTAPSSVSGVPTP